MFDVTINYVAVVVAAVASMIVGSLWYGPLFGKQWMKLAGFDKKSKKELDAMKEKAKKSYALGFLACLVTSFVLAHFVVYLQATDFIMGAQLGFWLWLGFFATTQLGMVLWEGKSTQLYLLNTAYSLVNLVIISGLIAVL